MSQVYIIVEQNGYIYNRLIVRRDCIMKYNNEIENLDVRVKKKTFRKFVNGILVHYFINELYSASNYRNSFINMFLTTPNSKTRTVIINLSLVSVNKELIDLSWNDRITYLVRERCELEHTLSWLSTLGGAFSALGDYFVNFAEIAGKISINQLYLAFRLGDPITISKCRLFISLSLIQQRRFKLAKKIIYREYVNAKNEIVIDTRLINMCKGIWCKLKYEYKFYRSKTHKV